MQEDQTITMKNPVHLECCCCGGYAPGRQWHNRDTGYGLCADCIDTCCPDQNVTDSYGHRFVHFDPLNVGDDLHCPVLNKTGYIAKDDVTIIADKVTRKYHVTITTASGKFQIDLSTTQRVYGD